MYRYSSGTTKLPSESLVQTLSSKRENTLNIRAYYCKQIRMNHLFLVDTKVFMNITSNLSII